MSAQARRRRARGWTLLESLIAATLTAGFLVVAGGVSLRLSRHYRALGVYADDLARATRQLDQVAHDVRRARRTLEATPDRALKSGGLCLVLERPDGSVISYRRVDAPRAELPWLERRTYRGDGPPRIENLGRIDAAAFTAERAAGSTLVHVAVQLPSRGGGEPAWLDTAARCQAGPL